MGHFIRECRGLSPKIAENRNQATALEEPVNVEELLLKPWSAIDCAGSQIPDKIRKGMGFVSYNVVPPPPTGLFSPPNLDLSNSSLDEFQQPEFEGYGPKTNDKLEKKTVFPTVAKIEFVRPKQQEKPVRKPVKYAEMYSIFTWVFFLATKDETSGILKRFITEIENLVDKKVKIIICDNGTKFKNKVMSEFCEQKGIKREFSAEAINTACYVQNRVLVVNPYNKTPYELFRGRTPALSFMRPFGCHVTILNTLDYLGKFDGKSDEGFFVRYSMNSKAFRVYNIRTRKVEENLHIRFLEDKPIIAGDGPKWLFDIDVLKNQ
ncbi:putative ribonuclease H-like domain-containing protein [Tanacetum coccineum]